MVKKATPVGPRDLRPGNLVEAVVMLQPKNSDQLPTPSESKEIASAVLRQATQETGLEPSSSTIFENMNSFSVRAASEFVQAIARCPSVAKVVPNEEAPSLIDPIKRRPVKIK